MASELSLYLQGKSIINFARLNSSDTTAHFL